MVKSGLITNMEELTEFDNWWSAIDMKDYITPRDFMYSENDEKGKLIGMRWLFAIPRGFTDTGKYEVIDFPGGLYAVGTVRQDEFDDKEILQWIKNSQFFEISNNGNDPYRRYILHNVITPRIFKEKIGYHLNDIFVPIEFKNIVKSPNGI